ncbi:AraC family transcriptional regulator [Kineococcus sp. NBC_00420]|uniref:AraC family transcriptional regulator n=1 Tax=Kineococcus sp. NBC_00420 TaxID=2903564 RepID=UPI002E1BC972
MGSAPHQSHHQSPRRASAVAVRELVPPDPDLSARWHVHDYPSSFARWNFHPEYEVHLARSGPGRYIVGDTVGVFGAGQLALIGPNVPHDWISDVEPGEVLIGRDVVFQFSSRWLQGCEELLPELRALTPLWSRSRSGVSFSGATAAAGAIALERIGAARGADRLTHIFGLFHLMVTAPEEEYELMSGVWEPRVDDPLAEQVVGTALTYVVKNLTDAVRLSAAASLVGMNESSFSRYFKRASGLSFTDMVRKLRLTQAANLLLETKRPVHEICTMVGYQNLSNFNRQFLAYFGHTPSTHRQRGGVDAGWIPPAHRR